MHCAMLPLTNCVVECHTLWPPHRPPLPTPLNRRILVTAANHHHITTTANTNTFPQVGQSVFGTDADAKPKANKAKPAEPPTQALAAASISPKPAAAAPVKRGGAMEVRECVATTSSSRHVRMQW